MTEFEIAYPNKNVCATMVANNNTVQRGSTALMVGGQNHSYQRLRDELVAKGWLLPKPENLNELEFAVNVPFQSSSAAASVVLGRTASGPLEWKEHRTKMTLKELQSRKQQDHTKKPSMSLKEALASIPPELRKTYNTFIEDYTEACKAEGYSGRNHRVFARLIKEHNWRKVML